MSKALNHLFSAPSEQQTFTFVLEQPSAGVPATSTTQTTQVPLANPPGTSLVPLMAISKAYKPPETTKPTTPFTAKELFEVVQAAIAVKIFEAKHGEKGEKLK